MTLSRYLSVSSVLITSRVLALLLFLIPNFTALQGMAMSTHSLSSDRVFFSQNPEKNRGFKPVRSTF